MTHWILLALLGLATYVILERSVARLTTVSWQSLWIVIMLPPSVVVASQALFQEPPPALIVLLLFLVSYITSVVLLQRGKLKTPLPTPAVAVIPANPISQHVPISEVPREQISGCFPWDVFHVQKVEYRPQAIICRGNLRTTADAAYRQVAANVSASFDQRFLVVLQEGLAGKPFFALVPNPAVRREQTFLDKKWLAIGLALATGVTTLTAAIPTQLGSLNDLMQWSTLGPRLSYAVPLLLILGGHEWSRWFTARWHQIPTTLPYFIPVPYALGTFGAWMNLKAPVPNRKTLFDLATAGPMVGGSLALLFLITGLSLSTTAPYPDPVNGSVLVTLQNIDPRFSLLLTILGKIILGSRLAADQVIQLHPLAFAGWVGLLILAFNLTPVGQLDGGHIVHAVYGQHMGANIGRITRVLVLLVGITIQPLLLMWGILLFFITSADEPALNDVTELDEKRDLLGLVLLTLMVLILMPVPPFLQSLIGVA